jgi:hypothetical protein
VEVCLSTALETRTLLWRNSTRKYPSTIGLCKRRQYARLESKGKEAENEQKGRNWVMCNRKIIIFDGRCCASTFVLAGVM